MPTETPAILLAYPENLSDEVLRNFVETMASP
jgi:hypothetical protein